MKSLAFLQEVAKRSGATVKKGRIQFKRSLPLGGSVNLALSEGEVFVDEEVYVEDLACSPLAGGVGSYVLKALCSLADEFGVHLTLYAVPNGRGSMTKRALTDWYKNFGFKLDLEEDPEMLHRRPE